MFLKRPKGLLGLDIGTSGVKMVELEGGKKGYQLKSFGNSLLPKETIVNGGLKNSSALVTAITNLTSSLKPKTKFVATSISGHPVIIKKIIINSMNDDELAESIKCEAEQYIPFEPEEVNIDYQVIGINETNPDPFKPFILEVKRSKEEADKNLQPLQRYELSQLKLVAIV